MRRREFIAGLGSAAAWPIAARAQQSAMPVVGYIGAVASTPFHEAFLKGLSEAGYNDGRNVAIAYRWVEGHNDRLAGFVGDLVGRHVAVILPWTAQARHLPPRRPRSQFRSFSGSGATRSLRALSRT